MKQAPQDRSRAPEGAEGIFERIRMRCAEVTRRARHVRIDDAGLSALADRLARAPWPEDDLDPAHHFMGDPRDTLSFTVALDAINFGSGWFPVLRKRSGMSGYRTIATACKAHVEQHGGWSAEALCRATPASIAALLDQDLADPEVAALMTLFAEAWRDLGAWLIEGYGGDLALAIESQGRSAAKLVTSLSEMPLYRDVARYEELEVPFFKRAQITAADLARAFGNEGWGRFDDLDDLTLFADNLVPHVLRCEGVLCYAEPLGRRIEAGALLEVGSPEEVEIRAVAVEAVERLVAALSERGHATTPRALDGLLWNAGQAPEIKARPRHRARCSFY